MNKKPVKNRRVTFTVQADPGSTVYLAGSFNDWNPQKKKMTDKKGNGTFTACLLLPPGSYEYKFVINGTWCVDPANCEWSQNDLGTLNSLLTIEV
ncbi:MAG: glycoside hydrolase [Lentisphaerae bacterium]|jgi:1,4-alpha-glucan branching enzyme|nr:glycoside hydrolase [Lentisphaerota bacterium]